MNLKFRNTRQKATALLIIVMALLLFSNISDRRRLRDVRESFSSIYDDRLMPATYIFRITDHLYQNRLLAEREYSAERDAMLQGHDDEIAILITQYETTYLTEEESRQWAAFKYHLSMYDASEKDGGNELLESDHFNQAMFCLNELSKIQVGEGSVLHEQSRAIIDGTNAFSEFEFTLVMILGLISLVLISLPDRKNNAEKAGKFSMN